MYDFMIFIVIGFIFICLFIFEFVIEGFVFLLKLINIIVIKLIIGNCLFWCEVDVQVIIKFDLCLGCNL